MTPKHSSKSFSKYAAIALIAAAVGASAQAQTVVASDNASNYAGGNWSAGSNGGTGFGPWSFDSNNGGNFIGSAANQGPNSAAIDTSGTSFALWAGSSGFANASRNLTASGNQFSIDIAYKWDNGSRGLNLLAGGTQVFNFTINAAGFSWTGNGSAPPAEWVANRENGAAIRITFSKTDTGFTYFFTSNQATGLNGQNGTITSATPDNLQVYVSDSGSGADADFFFNNLELLGNPPAPTITSPWSAVAVPGVAFSYQTTVAPTDAPTTYSATDLPEGLLIDPGSGVISGTVNATGYFSTNITATSEFGTGEKTIYFYVGKAADTALNYSQSGWTNGSNPSIGSGFGSWTLVSSNGSGAAGAFLGNPADAGIQELPAVSFGLYANPGDSGAFVDAIRELSAPLAVGEALAFDWGMNFDSNTANGSKGFIVLVDGAEAINVFNGNSGNITVNGVDTGFTYGTNAMFWQFFQSSNNSISIYGEPRNPSEEPFNWDVTTNGTITAVKFYAAGLDADGNNADKRQPYFNNLVIMPAELVPPTITSASSANGTAGDEFFYQTTVTPLLATTYSASGLPAGLSMNSTSGLISGTPETSGNSSVTINATNSAGESDPFVLDISIAAPEIPFISGPWGAVTVPGNDFSYQVETTPSGVPTTYSATGLPAGLSLDPTTGVISGNATSTGISTVLLTATNESGTSEPLVVLIVSGSAADLAYNYLDSGWTDGSNESQGTGFGNWVFATNSGNGSAGSFLGDPSAAGILDMANPSFGLFANPADSGASISVGRGLDNPLADGETLAFQWGIHFDAGNPTGKKGFILYVGTEEAIVVENAGNATITLNGEDIGMPFGNNALSIEFTQASNNTVIATTTSRDGSGAIFTTEIATSGRISGLAFYAGGLSDGEFAAEREPYFDSLLLMPAMAPAITSWPFANAVVGGDFLYQANVSPNLPTNYSAAGLPDGLTMNATTGVISGSPTVPGNFTATITAENAYGTNANFTLSLIVELPPAPVVTSPWGAVGVVGVPFAYQTTANPAGVATIFEATGLPSGSSIDSETGLITGTAVSPGYYNVNITATNPGGQGSKALYITIGKAADTAANYSGGNWTDGSNLSVGTGFGNWTFTSSNGSGAAGHFLGNPASAGITEMPAESFGLYANPGDSGAFVDARRELSSPLSVGETLEFDWGINFDSGTPSGSKGISVFVGDQEVVNIANGDTSNITVNGEDTGFAYGTRAMYWSLTQTSNTTVNVFAWPRDPSANLLTGSFSTNVTTNGTITAFKFYASGLADGAEREPYFNNFVIMPASGPSPTPYDNWASGYGLNPSESTGSSAGAPSADPDRDSFTNQEEFAFGTNPTEATAGLATTANEGGNLVVRFLTRDGLAYVVQTTNNLSTTPFADNSGVPIVDGPALPAPPSGYIRKQFTITPSGNRNFYRVVASEQTPG